jgi:glycosyltransferase involved in cell wall biosynthesis
MSPEITFTLAGVEAARKALRNPQVQRLGKQGVRLKLGGGGDLTGVLVEPRNPQALAAAMIALLRDPGKRQALATRAKAVAAERHLPLFVAARALQVYRDMLVKEGADLPATARAPDRPLRV